MASDALLTVLASLWWIVGLSTQSAYGLDILKFTETLATVSHASLPSEVLRYYMLRHSLIPMRFNGDVAPDGYDAVMRDRLVPAGAEFISARDLLCNAEGCLTRIGNSAADISTSDQIHLTANGSAFLIDAIIDRLLGGQAPPNKP